MNADKCPKCEGPMRPNGKHLCQGSKAKREAFTLEHMIECLAADMLDPEYPMELIKQELRDAGLDPEEVGRRGEELVAELRKKHGRTRSS